MKNFERKILIKLINYKVWRHVLLVESVGRCDILSSISPTFCLTMHSTSTGQALCKKGKWGEAEEALLSVRSEKITTDFTYVRYVFRRLITLPKLFFQLVDKMFHNEWKTESSVGELSQNRLITRHLHYTLNDC